MHNIQVTCDRSPNNARSESAIAIARIINGEQAQARSVSWE